MVSIELQAEEPNVCKWAPIVANVSTPTFVLIYKLIERDQKGKKKYGTSLDRKDLTKDEWQEHLLEELLDAAGYIETLRMNASGSTHE